MLEDKWIDHENVTVQYNNGPEILQNMLENYSDETNLYFEQIKKWIFEILKSWDQIKFNRLIILINFVFDTNWVDFINGWQRDGQMSLWSLKVLTLWLLLWLKTDETLELFWEHWQEIKSDPDSDIHPNITELNWWWIEAVKVFWLPFTQKHK